MHDESVNRDPERAFAAFLDRLATGEPGADGVDPALAETARDLHDRAARSTVSAPPAGTLASIRTDLFREPATHGRHRAALGLVPFPALLTRPATQIALAAAILLALVTGFTAFRGTGWLGHAPTSTHTAFAASATAPVTTEYAISADAENTTAYVAPGTAALLESPTNGLTPDVESLTQTCPMPSKQLPPGVDPFRYAWSVGGGPAWMAAGYSDREIGRTAESTVNPDFIPGIVTPTDYQRYKMGTLTPQGWRMQVFWFLDRSVTGPVTVHITRTSDGAKALTPEPLDPAIYARTKSMPPATGPMFAGSITFPGTGCYEMTASWSGGSSTVRFPFVQPASSISTSATPIASPSAATPSASTTCAMPDATSVNIPVTRDGQLVNVAGLGTSPLWLVGLGQRPAWYPATDPGFSVTPGVTIGGTPAPPAGTIDHVLWLMPTDNLMSVTVTGQNVLTGQRLVFQTLDASMRSNETTTAVFNPAADPLSTRFGAARLWWTGIIYPQPGCYEITATWASGSWTIRLPLPPPTGEAVAPACATPGTGATPGVLQTPGAPAHLLTQPRPPLATVQPGPPGLTPGIQQIATRPGVPLITPTPFATVIGVATPAGTPGVGCRGG